MSWKERNHWCTEWHAQNRFAKENNSSWWQKHCGENPKHISQWHHQQHSQSRDQGVTIHGQQKESESQVEICRKMRYKYSGVLWTVMLWLRLHSCFWKRVTRRCLLCIMCRGVHTVITLVWYMSFDLKPSYLQCCVQIKVMHEFLLFQYFGCGLYYSNKAVVYINVTWSWCTCTLVNNALTHSEGICCSQQHQKADCLKKIDIYHNPLDAEHAS